MIDGGTPTPYGGGRTMPVHASIEDARADLGSGLLLRLHAAFLGLREGQILRLASPVETLADELRTFEGATGHGLLSVIDDPLRAGWRLHYIRKGRARTDWAPDGRVLSAEAAPALAFDIDALMPRRLWLYTNYNCNLQCDYCCVVAGPRADPRNLASDRIQSLVDQASAAGLEHVFLTGGEPLLRQDLPDLIRYVTDRLPMTLLTNAMLLRGARWEPIRRLIEERRPVAFQVSLDSAGPTLHDAHRGRQAHARALEGIRTLRAAGARVRLAASLPEAHLDEIPGLHALADELGIALEDRVIRPIALRGAAAEGEPIRPEDVAPELTCDAEGWFWHPVSNDPDMRLQLPADASLGLAMAAVRRRLEMFSAEQAVRLDRFVCG